MQLCVVLEKKHCYLRHSPVWYLAYIVIQFVQGQLTIHYTLLFTHIFDCKNNHQNTKY